MAPKIEYNEFRVFGYPGTSKFSASAGSLVEKFTHFLQSLDSFDGESSLVQLWTPIRCSSGGVMLTVLEQPFAIDGLCKGLCRYRYSCIQQDIDVEGALVGPIGKVFTRGYHAYCDSTSSFAEPCGIGNGWRRWALPLFECDNGQPQQCAGVLEVFKNSLGTDGFWYFAIILEVSGIEYKRSDFVECFKARCSINSTIDEDMLDFVREELDSPLVQLWLPCMCDTARWSTNEFICTQGSTDLSSNYRLESDYLLFLHGSCTGKIQNPLVGRAYSENKACFIRDAGQLSISDYPLAHLTLSNRLKTCFVVPLKSIHPELHRLVLEVFLPRQQSCDQRNLPAQLNSILSTVARELSEYNPASLLRENEDFFVSNCHSDDDNVVFFEIHRNNKSMATYAAIGHGTEDSGQEKQQFPPTTLEANDHSKSMPEDTAQTSREVVANAEAEMAMITIPSGEVEAAVETLDGELVQSHEMLASSMQETAENSKEIPTVDQDKLTLDMINQNCGRTKELKAKPFNGELVKSYEMLGSSRKEQQLGTLEIKDHLNIQDTVQSSKKTCTVGEDDITLDMINRYRGRLKLADAAKELKVSRATLKRRCRRFGIKRWPHHKRNEVHNIQSNPGLPKTNLFNVGGRVIQDSEIMECSIPASAKGKSIAAENHEIDRWIVKASCGDDIVKFPFYSNSGIEQLREDLGKRFELEGGRFKIKYKDEDDDGEWIILTCNDDLLFHIETLTASGMSMMRLSVVPVTS